MLAAFMLAGCAAPSAPWVTQERATATAFSGVTPLRAEQMVFTPAQAIDVAIQHLTISYVRELAERDLIARCAQGIDGDLNDTQRQALKAAGTHADARTVLLGLRFNKKDDAAAVAGRCIGKMIEGLDPLTTFFSAAELREMQAGLPRYAIGVEIQAATAGLRIVDVYAGSPADRGGLRNGDVITQIDGAATAALPLDEGARRLRGPAASTIELTVLRQGNAPAERLSLRRAEVKAPPAVYAQRLANGVGYVVVDQFVESGRGQLIRAINTLQSEQGTPLKGLVLDLRWCTGGLLDTAVGIAAIFLPRDALVVELKGRAPAANNAFRATPADYQRGYGEDARLAPPGLGETLPLVVLTSRRTSAGGEIVAAALRDHGRAKLIGETTAGLGTIQTFYRLGDEGALKLTTAAAHTPRGERFDAKGVAPDVASEAPSMTPDAVAARAGRKRLPEAGDKGIEAALAVLSAAK